MSMFDRSSKNDEQQPAPSSPAGRPQSSSAASAIGPKTTIEGDITGEEDLVISGKVSGRVSLPEHQVTVRRDGVVKADIHGKTIEVEGTVNGNLFGSQSVVVRNSGRVEGNLQAPRVSLEDGANFRGSIDMKPVGDGKSSTGKVRREKTPQEKTGTGGGESAKSSPFQADA